MFTLWKINPDCIDAPRNLGPFPSLSGALLFAAGQGPGWYDVRLPGGELAGALKIHGARPAAFVPHPAVVAQREALSFDARLEAIHDESH